ncbi:MAG: hypothetical protein FJ217_16620, partial [Ignavibacteria bacterium]|nr:hypothetical protein [Ignavibacteria bacterium]
MRSFRILILSLLIPLSICYTQQDTITYDAASGDYIIKYYPEDEYGNRKDSAVTVIFEPATKIEAKVSCAVDFNAASKRFTYKYTLTNGLGSRQRLIDFAVEFGRNIEVAGKTLPGGWHSMRENEIEETKLTLGSMWSWHADIGLKPGRSWQVGALESDGLPGITICYFQGKTGSSVLAFPDEGPGYNLTVKLMQLRTFPSNRVMLTTVSPVSPPTAFLASAFVDSLISYKHQSYSLGWITNKGILNSLDQKLDNARKQLERGNTKAAKNILGAFINEV